MTTTTMPVAPEIKLGVEPMHGDLYFFAAFILVIATVCGWWLIGKLRLKRVWLPLVLASLGVVAAARQIANQAGKQETQQMVSLLRNLTKTYASETEFLHHHEVREAAHASSPTYLRLMAAQKRWLAANPGINDVYTFRYNAEGKPALIADSETDYDRNGKYEGDKESRTEIGEIWEGEDTALDAAMQGTAAFSPEAAEDRWGRWYSFYTPLRDPEGKLDGALGIDLDAAELTAKVRSARSSTLQRIGLFYVVLAGFICSLGGAAMLRRSSREIELAQETAQERLKFENLVLAVEGIVWESAKDPEKFAYVSPQVQGITGWEPSHWVEDEGFFVRQLHEADREWVLRQRRQAAAAGGSFHLDYRLFHRQGQTLWVRERGTVCMESGHPVLRGVIVNITDQKEHAGELERAQKQLVEASRQAGMAEVATGVLHNVGNVLNSVNISSSLIGDAVRKSSLPTLKSIANVLLSQADLPAFMASDRGKAVPGFIRDLHQRMETEHQTMQGELHTMTASVEHIKEIVMMQQSYARMGGRSEPHDLRSLVEDAVHINSAAISRHRIEIVADYQNVPPVLVERNKVLQILVNLLRNAKHAVDDFNPPERIIRISICPGSEGLIQVIISDNGVGISAENLERLFAYGFTTRQTGHGFGLHSSVNTAREMGGALTASSPGEGLGATFCLSLPAVAAAEAPAVRIETSRQPLPVPLHP